MEDNIPFGYNDNGTHKGERSFRVTKYSMQKCKEEYENRIKEAQELFENIQYFPYDNPLDYKIKMKL